MRVKMYGTRGSVPVANAHCISYGGNTTSLRIFSHCVPPDMALVCDGGSGYIPLSFDVLQQKDIMNVLMFLTHFHHDHTQGILLSPLTFMPKYKMKLCGPVDRTKGPKDMMEDMMRKPYFPVDFRIVASRFSFKAFEHPSIAVCLIHPQGGFKHMYVDDYERLKALEKFFPIGKGKYPLNECMVVTMYVSDHPDYAISYRFEEKPTGKVFVLLTDHENGAGYPSPLKAHLKDADVLVMDSQYTAETYEQRTAGFGHGTPEYCVRISLGAGVKRLGLTHHDFSATDDAVAGILATAQEAAKGSDLDVFACADYQVIEV